MIETSYHGNQAWWREASWKPGMVETGIMDTRHIGDKWKPGMAGRSIMGNRAHWRQDIMETRHMRRIDR